MVKKAYLRTLEVIIAIILVIGFIILISPKQQKQIGTPSVIKESRKFIFNEILSNEELKMTIISNNKKKCSELSENNLIQLISQNIPIGYSYECEICTTQTSCTDLSNLPSKDIYADSISLVDISNLNQLTIFRLYLWEK